MFRVYAAIIYADMQNQILYLCRKILSVYIVGTIGILSLCLVLFDDLLYSLVA